jgi:mRNA interferase RelE/StbE
MYEIKLSRKAAKFYQKVNAPTTRRLNAAFDRLAEDPLHHYNIKQLSGELQGSYRLRIGNIRIIYSIDDTVKIVYIEVIGFRGDVYKK